VVGQGPGDSPADRYYRVVDDADHGVAAEEANDAHSLVAQVADVVGTNASTSPSPPV
jgi:hypothetical protein